MGADLDDRRAAKARFQPRTQRSLLSLRYTELTAFTALENKRIPTILHVGFMSVPDDVFVQIEKLCDPSTAFPVVEQ